MGDVLPFSSNRNAEAAGIETEMSTTTTKKKTKASMPTIAILIFFVRFKIVKNISTSFAVYLFQQGLTNGQKLSQIITFHTLIVCFLRN